MKNKKIVVALIALTMVAVAGKLVLDERKSQQAANSSASEMSEAPSIHSAYPNIPESNAVVTESARDTINRYKEGSGIVFLGFKECPWCQKLLPIVNEAAAAEGIKVHYLDIRQARADNTAEYQELVSILSPYLAKDEQGQARISVPDVSIVRDGEIIFRHENESVTSAEKTPDTYWTDARKQRTLERFKEEIQKLKQSNEGNV